MAAAMSSRFMRLATEYRLKAIQRDTSREAPTAQGICRLANMPHLYTLSWYMLQLSQLVIATQCKFAMQAMYHVLGTHLYSWPIPIRTQKMPQRDCSERWLSYGLPTRLALQLSRRTLKFFLIGVYTYTLFIGNAIGSISSASMHLYVPWSVTPYV